MNIGSSGVGMTVFLAALAPTASAQQCGAGGWASVDSHKVTCGAGLLPFMIEGDIDGKLDVPAGQLTFPGKHVLVGYCGYPAPGSAPTLIRSGKQAAGCSTEAYRGPDGASLTCAHDQLPFILKGSATGTLHTSTGDVVLQGDRNDIAVCLSVARPRQAP